MHIVIQETESEQRLDRFCRKYFKNYPEIKLSNIYKFIRKGLIKVNNQKVNEYYRLKLKDVVEIQDSITNKLNLTKQEKLKKVDVQSIKKLIIFEDESYIFFNKPVGVVVHEGNKHMEDITMNDYLAIYTNNTHIKTSNTFSPAFCFRLDKDTSGIIVAAKTYDSLKHLNKLIREHSVKKKYLCIVKGDPGNKTVNIKIKKVFDRKFGRAKMIISNDGTNSITNFKTIKTINNNILGTVSLVEAELLTGKMHQIRVHLSFLSCPIVGDLLYGDPIVNRLAKKLKITRQLLHSFNYSFEYKGKKYDIICSISDDFKIIFPGINKN